MTVTHDAVEMLQDMVVAFNRHDLDAFMAYFTDDAVFESPRGPEPWGRRYEGKQAVREAMEGRIRDIPNVHYGQDTHFVTGARGVSEWTLTGTTPDGQRLEYRGCDLWTFRDGRVSRKDSFWKSVLTTTAG